MNRYKCTKCGKNFEIKHEVEVDGALCNRCFSKLVKIKNYPDYVKFISSPTPERKEE